MLTFFPSLLFVVFSLSFMLQGCISFRTSNAVPRRQDKMISQLKSNVKKLNQDLYNIELKKEKELADLRNLEKRLKRKLQKEIEENRASVTVDERGLAIQFLSEIFFDQGEVNISSDGKISLDKVSKTLSDFKYELRIEGHTDNQPIRRTKKLYRSNWELSAARSLSVLNYLVSKGISPKLFSVVAYGEYKPVASNEDRKGRKKNRRVEIVIVPNYYDDQVIGH